MAMRDYMQPHLQMRQFSFRKTRWQRFKAAIRRGLLKLMGKESSN